MDTMYFGPMDNAIDIAPDLQMPQFSLVESKHRDCSMNYTSGIRYVYITIRASKFKSCGSLKKLRFLVILLRTILIHVLFDKSNSQAVAHWTCILQEYSILEMKDTVLVGRPSPWDFRE